MLKLVTGRRGLAAMLWLFLGAQAHAAAEREAYVAVPVPAGVKVEMSELDGPVFADPHGRTLYRWPTKSLRNGPAGDTKDTATCGAEKTTVTAGLMSPYPKGLRLPDIASRPSCAQVWPPFLAGADARLVGDWTVVQRPDGGRQWAYKGFPLYTSVRDQHPGETFGASKLRYNFIDTPALREPVGPPPDLPPGFEVDAVRSGRVLVTDKHMAVYASSGDRAVRSNCADACLQAWSPIPAPALARPHGDWTIVARSPGVGQWAFRGQPLYTHIDDRGPRSLEGSDEPGWRNVYISPPPKPPAGFTLQDTTSGQVLADARGRTIYLYNCTDDSKDQLACDNPETTQAYRLAICGDGDAARCLATFPPVSAPPGRGGRGVWSAIDIDPKTGRLAAARQAGALHVWAYRGAPIYTYAGDAAPGDINGDGQGEFRGERDGFRAFWLRDDLFFTNAGG